MYTIENYNGNRRFNEQYGEIYQFLLNAADTGCNEHFHWGRFEWMMGHTDLEEDKLPLVAIFRNQAKEIAGLATFDTVYGDRTYLVHSIPDKELLREMVDYVVRGDEKPLIKVNSKDTALCGVLQEYNFHRGGKCDDVLQLDLNRDLHYSIPGAYCMSGVDFQADIRKYQLVLHKGFDHDGEPEPWGDDVSGLAPHGNVALRVFAMDRAEYCAHCGIWYTEGKTAYIEPVVTIPECRKLGLAKAVIYEAAARAKKLGAKRAVVLSGQEFYYKIGFEACSDFYAWTLEGC